MSKETRCPYCLDDLVGKERIVRCASCRTPHHAVCFDEHGGCVAFGCGGLGRNDAGQSVMLRKTLELGARWREVRLEPLREQVVRYRPAKRVADESGSAPEGAWVRISLEQDRLYPSQDLKARVVVAVPRDTVVRRLELRIFDEPLASDALEDGDIEPRLLTARLLGRQPFAAGTLLRSVLALAAPSPRLRPGHHPWQVEVPRLFGSVIERGDARLIQVGVVLERVGEPTVASPRATVTLLPRPAREPEPLVGAGAVGDPAHAMILQSGENVLAQAAPPPPAVPAWLVSVPEAAPPRERGRGSRPRVVPIQPPPFPDDLALARIELVEPAAPRPPRPEARAKETSDDLIGPPRDDSGTRRDGVEEPLAPAPPPSRGEDIFGPDPFAAPAPLEGAPPAPRPSGLPIVVRPRDPARAPRTPAPPPPLASDGWAILPFRAVTTAGPRTGRVLRARFAPRADLPPLRLSLEVPARGGEDAAHVIEIAIDAPHAFDSLDLACRYELQDAGGRELAVGEFPMVEEVAIVGEGGLDPSRSGKEERLLVALPLDPFLLEETRTLRAPDGAAPAELVLRLACEAIDPSSVKATSGTRVVRVPLGAALGAAPPL